MACCLLLTLFVGGVVDRSAVANTLLGQSRSAGLTVVLHRRSAAQLAIRLGRHWKVWLVLLAAAEIGASWLLVTALIDLSRHSLGLSAGPMGMPLGASGPSVLESALILVVVLGALALTAALLPGGLVQPADRLLASTARPSAPMSWFRRPRACAYVSFLGYAIAFAGPVRAATDRSHLILMGQLMLLLVAAPALLMSVIIRGTDVPAEPDRVRRVLAPLAAVSFVAVLYLWHLPFAHNAAMADPGVALLRIASAAIAGLALWGLVLDDRHRHAVTSRLVALLIVAIPSGFLGIALVIGPRPLFAMAGPALLGLGPLTDQRLAGLLMMATDVLFLVPIASHLLAQIRPDDLGGDRR